MIVPAAAPCSLLCTDIPGAGMDSSFTPLDLPATSSDCFVTVVPFKPGDAIAKASAEFFPCAEVDTPTRSLKLFAKEKSSVSTCPEDESSDTGPTLVCSKPAIIEIAALIITMPRPSPQQIHVHFTDQTQ